MGNQIPLAANRSMIFRANPWLVFLSHFKNPAQLDTQGASVSLLG
jgi:hypothetical protein